MRKQLEIAGTEPDRIQDLDDAAIAWRAAQSAKADAAGKEKLAHELLLSRMSTHGVTRYRFVDDEGKAKLVVIGTKARARVEAARPAKAGRVAPGGGLLDKAGEWFDGKTVTVTVGSKTATRVSGRRATKKRVGKGATR